MSNVPTKADDRLKSLINTDQVKQRFQEMLGSRAPAFMSSVISAVGTNPSLKKCEPMSVISAAAIAASMDLPINQSLGFAYIVPYGDNAQFQIGWKGIIQLAMRSGQYKTINITPVYEGQIKSHNPFTGEMEFNAQATSDQTVGYLLYFKLLNGYEKYFYMTKEQCQAHGKKYSKQFAYGKGRWAEDFDSMALKTVAKLGLSKYGILSLDMQKAIELDQSETKDDAVVYSDNPTKDQPQAEQEKPKASSRLKNLIEETQEIKDVTPQAPQSETVKIETL